jgi:hypothetical protein
MLRPTTTGDYVHGTTLGDETIARVSQGTVLQHTEWACVTPSTVVDTTPAVIQPGDDVRSSPLGLWTNIVNHDVAVGPSNVISLSPAGGAFSIAGLAGGWEGREVMLINPTGYPMTIKHQDATDEPTLGNRIMCAAGTDLVLPSPPGGFSWCRLKYCTLLSAPGLWLALDSSPAELPPWQFLPQVVLSLRSDIGVTAPAGTVTGWADQSGLGNSVGVGATAVSGPAYNATGGPNGFPILNGFTNGTYLDNTISNLVGSGAPRTVLFVGQATTAGGDYFTFRRGGSTHVCCFAYVSLTTGCYCWTDATTANETFPCSSLFVGTPVIIIATYQNGSPSIGLRVNGQFIAPISGGALTPEAGPNGFSVGVSEMFTSPAWDGYILEQHVCAVELTLAQCQQFEAYASARYGIAL